MARVPSGSRGPLAGFVAFGVFWGGWAVLLPAVQTAVGASKGQLGLALLGAGIGSLPAMLTVGRVIDRGVRGLVPLSLAGLALVGLLPAFVGSVGALAGALVLVGACSGAVDVGINAEASAIEAETGGRLMQLAHGLYSIGVMAGAIACGLLRGAGAGRLEVLAVLAAVLVAAAVANVGRPARARTGPRASARPRLRRPLLLLGAACAAAFVVEGGIENWSALFLQRTLDAGPAASAAGPASYATAMATGRLLGQRLTGRVSDRLLLSGGAALALVGLAGASVSRALPPAAVAFFVAGAGISVAAPILFGAAGRGAASHERASAVATVTTVGYGGFLVGPPLVGGIAQASGLRVSFLALAGFAALLAALAPRLALPGGARAAAGEV